MVIIFYTFLYLYQCKGVAEMKIEKISDNQIRCTLSHQDLVDRELKISELAYGTEKAKALFRDMMQQASYEFGFEAEDIPIMIEAIPVSRETLILIITKVEDPDELDTRFSKFSTEKPDAEDYFEETEDLVEELAEELLDRFDELSGILNENSDSCCDNHNSSDYKNTGSKLPSHTDKTDSTSGNDYTKVFSFDSLDDVTDYAVNIADLFDGKNSLYKNPLNSKYLLVLKNTRLSQDDFRRVCNIASEFGHPERITYASSSYYNEHLELIIKNKALQVLGAL